MVLDYACGLKDIKVNNFTRCLLSQIYHEKINDSNETTTFTFVCRVLVCFGTFKEMISLFLAYSAEMVALKFFLLKSNLS